MILFLFPYYSNFKKDSIYAFFTTFNCIHFGLKDTKETVRYYKEPQTARYEENYKKAERNFNKSFCFRNLKIIKLLYWCKYRKIFPMKNTILSVRHIHGRYLSPAKSISRTYPTRLDEAFAITAVILHAQVKILTVLQEEKNRNIWIKIELCLHEFQNYAEYVATRCNAEKLQ